MERISILTPTKGRPALFERMYHSIIATADHPRAIEFVVSINGRDEGYLESYPQTIITYNDEKKNLSSRMNDLFLKATGDIFVGCDDDIVFRTSGWDTKVREAFALCPDKIVLVYGDDGNPQPTPNCAFPIIHRRWAEVVGRLYTPHFSSDFSDTWFTDIATNLNRVHKIDILMEHHHWGFGKREKDQTDIERWEDHFRDDMPQKYLDTLPERQAEEQKLREYIEHYGH